MRYPESYSRVNDIDCFCKIKGVPVHFASNGTKIPNYIERSVNDSLVILLHNYLHRHPIIHTEVFIDRRNIQTIEQRAIDLAEIDNELWPVEMDVSSFEDMAKLGFVSFYADYSDEEIIGPEERLVEYKIIAAPSNSFHGSPLLQGIIDLLPEAENLQLLIPNSYDQLNIVRRLREL